MVPEQLTGKDTLSCPRASRQGAFLALAELSAKVGGRGNKKVLMDFHARHRKNI